jgi:hypothetical protein
MSEAATRPISFRVLDIQHGSRNELIGMATVEMSVICEGGYGLVIEIRGAQIRQLKDGRVVAQFPAHRAINGGDWTPSLSMPPAFYGWFRETILDAYRGNDGDEDEAT